MANVNIQTKQEVGVIKRMHAVNNGPIVARGDQTRGNDIAYQAARIPYARTHDAAFCSSYGGEHTVDIYAVFPDFDADPEDPASYDFVLTDRYCSQIRQVGTKVFYRLGAKIEHAIKKYNIWPPKDFHKWAVICEHIIAHYTEGWADGFHWDMEYWEIWNEPDLDPDDKPMDQHRCWCGTAAQFYEFYRIAATHLKKRFPHLKIGGPAVAGWHGGVWMENFLRSMTDGERVPIDFFSWHIYTVDPQKMVTRAGQIRQMLDRYGYTDTESTLDEWNYVRGWSTEFIYSLESIVGAKGAAFSAACMSAAQNSSIDMLMYYDTQPTIWNGMFDYISQRPLKGYYPFYLFANLYELGKQVAATSDDDHVYLTAAADETRAQILLTYYAEEDDATGKQVSLTVDRSGVYECALTDGERTMEKSTVTLTAGVPYTFTLQPQSILYLEAKSETL